jgi:hypothetical protein
MQALCAAISMIYSGSNVEFDGFKNTGYVTRDAHVFSKNLEGAAEWNWLKQESTPCQAYAREVLLVPEIGSPRIAPGAFVFTARYGFSSGMLL